MKRYKSVHDTRRLVIRIAVGFVVALALLVSPLWSWLLGPAHALARPFWWVSQRIAVSTQTIADVSRSKRSLVTELTTTQAEIEQLRVIAIENTALRSENAELQGLLDGSVPLREGVTARVLVRPPYSWYDALVIDRGANDAIAIGDRVYGYGTVPLGTVVAVADTTATVELYSASDRVTDAIVVPGNIPVIVRGTGNGSFHFQLHRDNAVDEQSVIILPTGEVLGTVASVQFDTRDPFRSVRAVSAVNVQNLRFITVVTAQ